MANNHLATGTLGLDVIRHFEGFENKSYLDAAGIWTIGYGTIRIDGKPVQPGMTCTEDQAIGWLADDVRNAEKGVQKLVTVPLAQYQFDALVAFVYNCGEGNFSRSTLLKRINWKEPVEERHFTDWNKARVDGVLRPLGGLTRRRKSEHWLYHSGTLRFEF